MIRVPIAILRLLISILKLDCEQRSNTDFVFQIPGQLETFRTDQAREKAFTHHASDCTSRTGVFGHGIYESPKS